MIHALSPQSGLAPSCCLTTRILNQWIYHSQITTRILKRQIVHAWSVSTGGRQLVPRAPAAGRPQLAAFSTENRLKY
eukprot:COSAG06_NODE_31250_length_524_cov_1.531765_1_plen_76_part_10